MQNQIGKNGINPLTVENVNAYFAQIFQTMKKKQFEQAWSEISTLAVFPSKSAQPFFMFLSLDNLHDLKTQVEFWPESDIKNDSIDRIEKMIKKKESL